MQPRRRSRSRKFLRFLEWGLFISLIVGIFSFSGFLLWAASIKIPDFSLFENRKVSQSTKIYDRTGTILLYDVHRDVRRTIVPLDKVSTHIKNATIAIEDDQFYQHEGIEPKAILRAVLVNLGLMEGYSGQGGSTITQQVIKNALLTKEKTITRKVKEWILAIKLERVLTKDEILALYLNEAPYGGNIYGVEEASLAFFGVPANMVSLPEAAYLAALPQAPTYYSPFGSHTDDLEARKNTVLRKMRELGSISDAEYREARDSDVEFLPPEERGIRAPHFVMFVRDRLVELYGEEAITEGGFRVITTIDMELQEKAEEIVEKFGEENEKSFNATNAALVAIDPKNGQILTMVGSRDYFNIEREGNFNIAIAKRQPGSAFKPFVYAAAFEAGYTPNTVVFDVPTQFSTRCDTLGKPLFGDDPSVCYMPTNYDEKYRGPISLRNALAQSINVPAVKMLYLVGLDAAIDMAERLGITTLVDKARYGLTLVLGGGEVSLLDLTSAYGVFANDGVRVPYESIIRIEDAAGGTVAEFSATGTPVIDPDIARNISDVLSDNVARTPAFGDRSFLYFEDRDVAVKTGTTNDYRDAWIVGYTPSIAVGAWAGNNDNTPMEKKVAGFIIAPLWNAFMKEAFKVLPIEDLPSPKPISPLLKPALRGLWYGGDIYAVDKVSGKLATSFTPPEFVEERVVPNPHEILYWVDRKNPAGPPPMNPYTDPQFLLWEIPAQAWIINNGLPSGAWKSIPEGFDDLHTPEHVPVVEILNPSATSTFLFSEKVFIELQIKSTYAIERVDFFVNDVFVGSSQTMPYYFAFVPRELSRVSPENDLLVVVYDTVGNKSSAHRAFSVAGIE